MELIHENVRGKIYRNKLSSGTNILKVFNALHPSQYEIAKFLHEFKILENLNHPHIIKAVKRGQYDLKQAIWLEDIGGKSLCGRASESEAKRA